MCVVGNEDLNTPLYCHIDRSHCYLMTETLSRYTLVGQSVTNCKAVKALALMVFAPEVHTSSDFNLRVYCVQDTQAAMNVSFTAKIKI